MPIALKKPTPKQKGLKKLPTTIRNKMGYMKSGGSVKKSSVNKAGNYTKPSMRKTLFNKIKAGTKGGNAGQWSARKAQMRAKQYKSKGGGYK